MMDLKNKNALISGGTHGIGLEILKKLAKKIVKCFFHQLKAV